MLKIKQILKLHWGSILLIFGLLSILIALTNSYSENLDLQDDVYSLKKKNEELESELEECKSLKNDLESNSSYKLDNSNILQDFNIDNSQNISSTNSEIRSSNLYFVKENKVYFYLEPNRAAITKRYLIKGDVVEVINFVGDFCKVTFTNKNYKTTIGYILISELEIYK